jgi:hypothetical protein
MPLGLEACTLPALLPRMKLRSALGTASTTATTVTRWRLLHHPSIEVSDVAVLPSIPTSRNATTECSSGHTKTHPLWRRATETPATQLSHHWKSPQPPQFLPTIPDNDVLIFSQTMLGDDIRITSDPAATRLRLFCPRLITKNNGCLFNFPFPFAPFHPSSLRFDLATDGPTRGLHRGQAFSSTTVHTAAISSFRSIIMTCFAFAHPGILAIWAGSWQLEI